MSADDLGMCVIYGLHISEYVPRTVRLYSSIQHQMVLRETPTSFAISDTLNSALINYSRLLQLEGVPPSLHQLNFPRGKGWLLVEAQEQSKGEQTKTASLEASS